MTGEVRLLLQTAADFDGMKLGARFEDAKADFCFGPAHRKAWKRVAIVTDSDWLRGSFRVWSHFVPVEMKIFTAADAADARTWVGGQEFSAAPDSDAG